MCIRDRVNSLNGNEQIAMFRNDRNKKIIALAAVSYTHLDVYKRQVYSLKRAMFPINTIFFKIQTLKLQEVT